jgi:hypothetical protein
MRRPYNADLSALTRRKQQSDCSAIGLQALRAAAGAAAADLAGIRVGPGELLARGCPPGLAERILL